MRSLGGKEIKNYARKGILTVTQLAHTFRPRRRPKRAAKSSSKRYHALQALAIRDKRIYVFGSPNVTASPVAIYLDVESTYEQGTVYLIGMIVVENGSESRYSLWADNHDQEQHIVEQFLALLGKYSTFNIFCYGGYEKDFLNRMRRHATDKTLVDNALNRLTNTLSLIYSHIYFPTYSNGLKDIGRYLGCSWTEKEASGIQSMVWRSRWEASRDEKSKNRLLTYNLEDCAALKRVTELVHGIAASTDFDKRTLTCDDTVPISFVQDVDKLTHDRKWGRVQYVHPEYEYINDCAYFDYQRDKVFVRTSKILRTRKKIKQAGSRNRSLKATQTV